MVKARETERTDCETTLWLRVRIHHKSHPRAPNWFGLFWGGGRTRAGAAHFVHGPWRTTRFHKFVISPHSATQSIPALLVLGRGVESASRGVRRRIWMQAGPAGMAHRSGARYATPGALGPRLSRLCLFKKRKVKALDTNFGKMCRPPPACAQFSRTGP